MDKQKITEKVITGAPFFGTNELPEQYVLTNKNETTYTIKFIYSKIMSTATTVTRKESANQSTKEKGGGGEKGRRRGRGEIYL